MDNDDVSQSGTQIAKLFREINSILNQQLRKAFQGLGLTPPQMMILHYISKKEHCKVSDISKEFNMAASTVSSILDRLERNDLVLRERKKEDKRVVQISLSEKAFGIKGSLTASINKFMEDMTQAASDEELDEIIGGLFRMKELLNRDGLAGESQSRD